MQVWVVLFFQRADDIWQAEDAQVIGVFTSSQLAVGEIDKALARHPELATRDFKVVPYLIDQPLEPLT